MSKTALLIVDMQNDFMPGGPLGVAGADELVPVINAVMDEVDLVVSTQDWHPEDHVSFASNHPNNQLGDVVSTERGDEQFLWPDHCVADTEGAELVAGLELHKISYRILKGTSPDIDSYSGFYDNNRHKATGLAEILRSEGIEELLVCGVATDYCVKFTVLDALSEGFKVRVGRDGVAGVNVNKGDAEAALGSMQEAGALISAHLKGEDH